MNMVECKKCGQQFDYKPGVAGNARQMCNTCREIVDIEELKQLEEETIIEDNKYLVDAPKKVDPLEIMEGNFPKFENDADAFICAVEFGKFLNKCNGFGGKEETIAKFCDLLDDAHFIVFIRQLRLYQLEIMTHNKVFTASATRLSNLIIDDVAHAALMEYSPKI